MRSQHAHTTTPGGNRQARRKARKLSRKQRQPVGSPAQAIEHGGASKLATALDHVRTQRFDEAAAILNRVFEDNPDSAAARNLMGQILDGLDKSRDAYQHHKMAVTLDPDNGQYWRDFGRCLHALKQNDATVVAFERAATLLPHNADCYQDLGAAYSAAGRIEAAIAAFKKSLAASPDSAFVWTELGCQLQILGDFGEAQQCFEHALRLDPGLLEAHFQLSMTGERDDRDIKPVIAKLKDVVACPDLEPRQRALGFFTLARLHERQRDYNAAFEFYAEANDTLKSLQRLDWSSAEWFVDDSIEGFTAETFERLKDAGSPSDLPIFVVGMPRSGTTLVEQILSSHPSVSAGGESRKIGQLAVELTRASSQALHYPRQAAALEPRRFSEIGYLYLKELKRAAPADVARITDKQPFNYMHLGLISVLFPKAAIIHCRRDPMDTCLSCYFQHFKEREVAYLTNDFEDLGKLYHEYCRFMEHWRDVLPSRVLDIDYEELVQDQEAVSRRLIEFVGLDWDSVCLQFHQKGGSVKTASMWQVRQPIYTSSLSRWRRYEKHLEPLKEALAGVL